MTREGKHCLQLSLFHAIAFHNICRGEFVHVEKIKGKCRVGGSETMEETFFINPPCRWIYSQRPGKCGNNDVESCWHCFWHHISPFQPTFAPYRSRLLLPVWQFSESNLYLLASVSAIIIMFRRRFGTRGSVSRLWLCVTADGKIMSFFPFPRHPIDFSDFLSTSPGGVHSDLPYFSWSIEQRKIKNSKRRISFKSFSELKA